jgi:hypothetical protein
MAIRDSKPPGPIARLLYVAEVYDDDDEDRESAWQCDHRHESPLDAHRCGLDWVRGRQESDSDTG